MSPKLPVVSGAELIRVLQKIGYEVIRQRGSHVRLYPPPDTLCKPTTVPLHNELSKGTLKGILPQAGLSADEFLCLLER